MDNELLNGGLPSQKRKEDLNNANGTLAMGIVSVSLSFLLIGGYLSIGPLVVGILAIVKGIQAMSLYKDYPNDYTESSYNKAKAGFICGIIGTILCALEILMVFGGLFSAHR